MVDLARRGAQELEWAAHDMDKTLTVISLASYWRYPSTGMLHAQSTRIMKFGNLELKR